MFEYLMIKWFYDQSYAFQSKHKLNRKENRKKKVIHNGRLFFSENYLKSFIIASNCP